MYDFQHHPLENSADLDPLMDAIGDARVVMLGEASHGTSEYYTWRTAISKRLIREKGFQFIAVEGDWPDCYKINQYIKNYPGAGDSAGAVLHEFHRWPTWMWGNWEVDSLAEWLRKYNTEASANIGFYGLDIYSLWESLHSIVDYLEKNDGVAVNAAVKAFQCFEPYSEDPQAYARATAFVPNDCEDVVLKMLQNIQQHKLKIQGDPESKFSIEQNARVAVNAEKYYRTMIKGGTQSWNVRDRHMMDTLQALLDYHGSNSKAIVWEHNTHIGDARATNMYNSGMFNIGQLAREELGKENVFLTGFGSFGGSVIAGQEWGARMQKMQVPEAKVGSWEFMLHDISSENKLILSDDLKEVKDLFDAIGHRAIGVVYDPKYEKYGNYVPSVIPRRYDAFLYFEKTKALHPFKIHPDGKETPDLYPWNF